MWVNKKLELENILEEIRPDLCFISESNLWNDTTVHERQLEGHNLIMPLTMTTMDHAWIILIVKDDLEVEVVDQYMDKEVATILVKLRDTKRNSIVIGGVNREHQKLGRTDPDASRMEIQLQQEGRWKNIIKKWKMAARNSHICMVIGDINLDFS